MPHSLFRFKEGKFAEIAATLLAEAETYAVNYAKDKIDEEIEKFLDQCPPPAVLESIQRTITSIDKVEQGYNRRIKIVSSIPKKLDKPIKAGKVIIDILTHVLMAKSMAFGVPPPQGGLLFSERVGKILSQASKLENAKKIIGILEDEKDDIGALLESTTSVFDPIKIRLDRLKTLLERCALDPKLSKEERDKILNNKLKPDDRSDREDYTSQSGRVYQIDIVDVADNNIDVPRRQAIAIDFRGIVVLRGQPSYASDPQVLKSELKFRIDNQLP